MVALQQRATEGEANMQFPTFGDASERVKLESLTDQAKMRRSQYLKENSKHLLKAIGGAAVALSFALLVTAGHRASDDTLGATARMEHLAAMLADAITIAPDTVREIKQLLLQDGNDCIQLGCDSALESRNRAARVKLKLMLARAALAEKPLTVVRTYAAPSIVAERKN
jgi:hypothetical protein